MCARLGRITFSGILAFPLVFFDLKEYLFPSIAMIPSGKARMYYVLSTMDGAGCEITSLWIIIIRVWPLANCLASLIMFTWWQNWGRCCLDCRITMKSEVEYKHILHAIRPDPGCMAQPGLCLLLVALVLLWRWGKLGGQTRWPWWRQEVLICIQYQFSLLKGTKVKSKDAGTMRCWGRMISGSSRPA